MNEWGYIPPERKTKAEEQTRRLAYRLQHLPKQLDHIRAKYKALLRETRSLGLTDLLTEDELKWLDTL